MNKKTISIFIAVAVVVGAASFYGGMKYGQNSAQTAAASQRARMVGQFRSAGDSLGGRRNGGLPNGDFINGEIISQDDKSLTVKLRDGGSKIVFLSSTTSIDKTVAGTASDLAVGKTVIINGTANSDGSLTATSVQIRSEVPRPESRP